LTQFTIAPGDHLIADRGYCHANGIEHVVSNGGAILVRLNTAALRVGPGILAESRLPLKILVALYSPFAVWCIPEAQVAWLRGEFAAARSHLEAATADHTAVDQHEIDAVWFLPEEPIALARIYLALVGLMRGDLVGADAELAQAARRAEQLGFPQGAWSLAYARFMESWLRIEAGQLDRAAALAADLREQAERHGFDQYRLAGASQEATVCALAALAADDVDQTALAAHIATITTLLDTFRTLEVNMYSTFYDAVLGRLLIAASQPEQARARLDTGLQLAEDTGMHFYDAELLRLRARTQPDPDARRLHPFSVHFPHHLADRPPVRRARAGSCPGRLGGHRAAAGLLVHALVPGMGQLWAGGRPYSRDLRNLHPPGARGAWGNAAGRRIGRRGPAGASPVGIHLAVRYL
jgi:hypothetical protein